MSKPTAPTAKPSKWRDLLSLTKPGITRMCVMMTAGGYWLAFVSHGPHAAGANASGVQSASSMLSGQLGHLLWVLLGATLVIGGSCAINMVMERERDKLMDRTSSRPLPTGRLAPWEASVFGVGITVLGLALLAIFANVLTAGLAALAWVFYVAIYTPLKGRTPLFLIVGTVPGAIPPLLGWTAITGGIDMVGMTLFAILVAWQLPHFLALSFMCNLDYAKADIRTVPLVRGELIARRQAFAYSLLLLPASLLLVPLQVAGWLYAIVACLCGGAMIWIAFRGLLQTPPTRWAHQLFFASLVYLPALTLALLCDRVLGFWMA